MDGFVWLEKGIVVAVGGFEEQEDVLRELRGLREHASFVRFVNADWKWVTPGLGGLCIGPCGFCGADVCSCGQLTYIRILGL